MTKKMSPAEKQHEEWKKSLAKKTKAELVGIITTSREGNKERYEKLLSENAQLQRRVDECEATISGAYAKHRVDEETLHIANVTIKAQADRMAEHLAVQDAKREERCRHDPKYRKYHEAVMRGGYTLKSAQDAAAEDITLLPYVHEFIAGVAAIRQFAQARKERDAK